MAVLSRNLNLYLRRIWGECSATSSHSNWPSMANHCQKATRLMAGRHLLWRTGILVGDENAPSVDTMPSSRQLKRNRRATRLVSHCFRREWVFYGIIPLLQFVARYERILSSARDDLSWHLKMKSTRIFVSWYVRYLVFDFSSLIYFKHLLRSEDICFWLSFWHTCMIESNKHIESRQYNIYVIWNSYHMPEVGIR